MTVTTGSPHGTLGVGCQNRTDMDILGRVRTQPCHVIGLAKRLVLSTSTSSKLSTLSLLHLEGGIEKLTLASNANLFLVWSRNGKTKSGIWIPQFSRKLAVVHIC